MRRLIFLVLLAASCYTGAAEPESKPDALAAVAAKLMAEPNFNRHFVQTKKLAVLKRPIKTEGTLLYRKDQGVCWATTTPIKSFLMLDENSIRQIGTGSTTTITAEQQPALFGFTKLFFAALSGRIETLRERFDIKMQGDASKWTLQLTPRDMLLKKFIEQMDLYGTEKLDRVSLRGRDDDVTEIEFSVVVGNDAQLEQSCFAK